MGEQSYAGENNFKLNRAGINQRLKRCEQIHSSDLAEVTWPPKIIPVLHLNLRPPLKTKFRNSNC